MSSVNDKAAQRKAERERRQARIRASGSSRLAKITGTAGTEDYKGVPKPPVAAAGTHPAEQTPPPVVAIDPPAADATLPGSDKLMQLLQQQQGDGAAEPLAAMLQSLIGGTGDASSGSPLFGVDAPDTQQQPQQLQQQQQQQQRHFEETRWTSEQRASVAFFWDLVHIAVSIVLGLFAGLGNPWQLSKAFVSSELALMATRLVLGHMSTGLSGVAMLAPFIGMLPRNRQRQISAAGAVFSSARIAYRDMAIVLFVYGCLTLGGRDFARPV